MIEEARVYKVQVGRRNSLEIEFLGDHALDFARDFVRQSQSWPYGFQWVEISPDYWKYGDPEANYWSSYVIKAALRIGELRMPDTGVNFDAVHDQIIGKYEPSRERSLALTKLEEAQMWLQNAAPAGKI
jgi:hypothetical protein